MITLTEKDADSICKVLRDFLEIVNDKIDEVNKDIVKINEASDEKMSKISAMHRLVFDESKSPEECRSIALEGANQKLRRLEEQKADFSRMIGLLISGSENE